MNNSEQKTNQVQEPALQKAGVVRSAHDLKLGQVVEYGGATCFVKKKNGIKCLAYPAPLGWSYFIPNDWTLVKPV